MSVKNLQKSSLLLAIENELTLLSDNKSDISVDDFLFTLFKKEPKYLSFINNKINEKQFLNFYQKKMKEDYESSLWFDKKELVFETIKQKNILKHLKNNDFVLAIEVVDVLLQSSYSLFKKLLNDMYQQDNITNNLISLNKEQFINLTSKEICTLTKIKEEACIKKSEVTMSLNSTIPEDLKDFLENLSDKVKLKSFTLAIRDDEIKKLEEILLQKKKNTPILIGDPGVGKTTLVEGLAQKINKKEIKSLENYQIISLKNGAFIAGTKYRGELEERLNDLINWLSTTQNIILFIDEIHSFISASVHDFEDSQSIANLLKPLLSDQKIKMIGATTTREFKLHLQKDEALTRRFHQIKLKEPNKDETKTILIKNKSFYENFHKVKIENNLIDLLVDQTDLFIKNSYYPDKAFDVLDLTMVKAKMSEQSSVKEDFIYQSISDLSQISLIRLKDFNFNFIQKRITKLIDLYQDQKEFIKKISINLFLNSQKTEDIENIYKIQTNNKKECIKFISTYANTFDMNFLNINLDHLIDDISISDYFSKLDQEKWYIETRQKPYTVFIFDLENNLNYQTIQEKLISSFSLDSVKLNHLNNFFIITKKSTNIGFEKHKDSSCLLNFNNRVDLKISLTEDLKNFCYNNDLNFDLALIDSIEELNSFNYQKILNDLKKQLMLNLF